METEHTITVSNNNGLTRELDIVVLTESDFLHDDYNSYPVVEEQITEVYYNGLDITDKLSCEFIDDIYENCSF